MSVHTHENEHNHTHDHFHNHENFEQTKKEELGRIITAAVFFAAGYILEKIPAVSDYACLVCFAISYISVGFSVVRHAIEDIMRKKIFNECFLMSVASLGAFIIREFSEGCAVMLLYAIGEYIHGSAIYKSKKEIRKTVGESGFNIRACGEGENESYIASFAKIYTPIICLIAVFIIIIPPVFFSGAWRDWVYRGLSALVIGCPCAIVISVPLSFSCAINACTRKGVYVYHSSALERLYKNGEQSEGIVIPDNDLSKLAYAKKAAKKAVFIAKENIFVAISVKIVVLVLVVFLKQELPMWLAAMSDIGIAIIAILNSLRNLKIPVDD